MASHADISDLPSRPIAKVLNRIEDREDNLALVLDHNRLERFALFRATRVSVTYCVVVRWEKYVRIQKQIIESGLTRFVSPRFGQCVVEVTHGLKR